MSINFCHDVAEIIKRSYLALTRGAKCLKPCCVCCVPKEGLNNLTLDYSLQTAKDSELHYNAAMLLKTKSEQQESMKAHGLRLVRVSKIAQAEP